MSSQPLVSVIIPAYNAEKYVVQSVHSILNQDYPSLEILVIEDGSTDRTAQLLEEIRDPRIRLIRNEKNRGIVYSRNTGLSASKGEYIAFLDSDDLAEPARLRAQVQYMESHPAVGLLGSYVRVIDSGGAQVKEVRTFPGSSDELHVELMLRNSIVTSSVMLRRSAIGGLQFSDRFPVAEDFDFWKRVSRQSRCYIYPEILVSYRVHNSNITRTEYPLLEQKEKELLAAELDRLLPRLSAEELSFFYYICKMGSSDEYYQRFLAVPFAAADRYITALYRACVEKSELNLPVLKSWLMKPWTQSFVHQSRFSPALLKTFASPFFAELPLSARLKFMAKCLLSYTARR